MFIVFDQNTKSWLTRIDSRNYSINIENAFIFKSKKQVDDYLRQERKYFSESCALLVVNETMAIHYTAQLIRQELI
jgi:hypothetical protein